MDRADGDPFENRGKNRGPHEPPSGLRSSPRPPRRGCPVGCVAVSGDESAAPPPPTSPHPIPSHPSVIPPRPRGGWVGPASRLGHPPPPVKVCGCSRHGQLFFLRCKCISPLSLWMSPQQVATPLFRRGPAPSPPPIMSRGHKPQTPASGPRSKGAQPSPEPRLAALVPMLRPKGDGSVSNAVGMQWDKNFYILFYVHNFRKGLPVIGCHVPTSVGGYGVPGGGGGGKFWFKIRTKFGAKL